jgi:hypothetical protein
VAVAGEQAHAIAVADHDQAVAVVLHFVEPSGVAGTILPPVGRQGWNNVLRMGRRYAPAPGNANQRLSQSGVDVRLAPQQRRESRHSI